MKVREIFYLKEMKIPIVNFQEAVTPASPDEFVDTDQFIDILTKVCGPTVSEKRDEFKECAYTSCTLLFAATAFNTGTIDEQIYANIKKKAREYLSRKSKMLIALTLLYEHHGCLTEDILKVYSQAGHEDVVSTYLKMFKHEFEEAQPKHIVSRYKPIDNEAEIFQPVYNNFMSWKPKY